MANEASLNTTKSLTLERALFSSLSLSHCHCETINWTPLLRYRHAQPRPICHACAERAAENCLPGQPCIVETDLLLRPCYYIQCWQCWATRARQAGKGKHPTRPVSYPRGYQTKHSPCAIILEGSLGVSFEHAMLSRVKDRATATCDGTDECLCVSACLCTSPCCCLMQHSLRVSVGLRHAPFV
jgi:hypothetical protein